MAPGQGARRGAMGTRPPSAFTGQVGHGPWEQLRTAPITRSNAESNPAQAPPGNQWVGKLRAG